jgi:hypothetical protein
MPPETKRAPGWGARAWSLEKPDQQQDDQDEDENSASDVHIASWFSQCLNDWGR